MEADNNIRIIPLGGLGQIGMNITAFEYRDSIVVVDCGLAFPEDDMLGIDLVIPDVSYLIENKEKLKGLVITHGHEDHIGAIPYVIRQLDIPIYATKLTMALIDGKLKEHGLIVEVERHVVNFGDIVALKDIRVEFIKTNHSIADACALAIHTDAGVIVHTGDFKVDYTPVFGEPIDLQRFAQLGKEGVLALLCDSTNAEREGYTSSEKTVGKAFESIFEDHDDTRIFVATFASNIDRIRQIINTAYKFGRKVAVQGRSIVNIVETAQEIGYLEIPANTLIDIDRIKDYPDEKLVIITTGSQGETMAALNRIANRQNKWAQIKPGDTVIFSSNPIPGNEKAVSKVINELTMQGADVIYQDAHVSGHASREEIKLIYALVRPKYAIPVHGEYKHLKAQAYIARDLGIPKENIFILQAGEVLSVSSAQAEITGKVETGILFVDGLGVGDVGNIVLRDRQILAENGVVIVVAALYEGTGTLASEPEIITRGFIYVRESDEIMYEMMEVTQETFRKLQDKGISDWNKMKSVIRDEMGSFIWGKMKRRPMVMAVFMEV
ncbi:MAG: ribonuclease J [Lachnospiraceae bacterium]|nr:ribonuclease J [Lachnospiraceae bacterium]